MKTEDRYEKGPCAMDILKGTVPYFQRYSVVQFGETCGTGQLLSKYVNMYEEISGTFKFMESTILYINFMRESI